MGVEVAADFRESGVHDLFAVLGLPIEGPVFVHDLDFAGGDEREEDVVLALLEHLRVVVARKRHVPKAIIPSIP